MNENDIKKLLGHKIKEKRTKLKFTQEIFSEKIGITQRQISLIELGKSFPTPKTLISISNVFECPISELFDFATKEETDLIKKKLNHLIKNLPDDKIKILYMIADNLF